MARSFRKEIKDPDFLQVSAGKTVEWYRANAKLILAAAATLIVVVAAIVGNRLWNAHVREQAALALAMAEAINKEQAGQGAENALRRAADAYPGTKSGVIARLKLAVLLRERGDFSAAEQEYRRLLKADELGGMDFELARRGLASSLSLQGKCAEAVPIWKEILAKGSLLTPEDIYIAIGACLEETGQAAEALKTYDELIQKHPRSPFITPRLRARMDRLAK
ncbi:tetratricopeptide repeat protein [Nitrospinota bacterium]